MPLTPGYGETPLPHDELTALLPHVVKVLEKPVSRAAVYDLEQAVQEQVSGNGRVVYGRGHDLRSPPPGFPGGGGRRPAPTACGGPSSVAFHY